MNILFITATRLGDAVLTTGILDQLIKKYPQAHITIACGTVAAGIFKNVPNLKNMIAMKKRRYNLHWLNLWQQCRNRKWDLIVDLRSSLISYLLKTHKRMHYKRHHKEQHVIDEYQDYFHLSSPPAPHIWISHAEKDLACQLLPSTSNYIAIAPTAGSDKKIWPAKNYILMWNHIAHQFPNTQPLIIYGHGEREHQKALPLLQGIPRARDFGAKFTLTQIAAILTKCQLFIGNDSGLMHLASSCNVPTLGLFGPSLANRYRPWGEHSYYLCANGPTGEAPMSALTVQKVTDKILNICHHRTTAS